MIPSVRRRHILERLNEKGIVRVSRLSQELAVSAMTIHRDLNRLQQEGQLRKVRGGAVTAAVGEPEQPVVDDTHCPTCYHRPHSHTQVMLHLRNGRHQRACCPHCGLMQIKKLGRQLQASLVTDFISGQTVNAQSATYIVSPDVMICCSPTVVAFLRHEDARRFQRGFGGKLMNMRAATTAIFEIMDLDSPNFTEDKETQSI